MLQGGERSHLPFKNQDLDWGSDLPHPLPSQHPHCRPGRSCLDLAAAIPSRGKSCGEIAAPSLPAGALGCETRELQRSQLLLPVALLGVAVARETQRPPVPWAEEKVKRILGAGNLAENWG